ncbi:peptide-methionine (S)-S-oxide reductase [Pediococcus ethanolidurans]|uniref:peptide-methionine (S)-S-oxide reductase n=1 Tax=Pediococcus ethanolidurans TaxID=319653 RepID=UPI0009E73CC4
MAETSKHALSKFDKYKRPIVTKILLVTLFWSAENFHQEFYKKFSSVRYKKMERVRQQCLAMQHSQQRKYEQV